MTGTHGGDIYTPLYETGREFLDFSANISPLGVPAGVLAAVYDAAHRLDRYPDSRCRELRAALSRYHRAPPDTIVCGNGAADLIYRLVQWRKPKQALVPAPSFSEYEKALRESGCEVLQPPLYERDFGIRKSVIDGITEKTDMLFLCNPNNPTGLVIPPDFLRDMLRACVRHDTTVMVDECFNGFLDDPACHTLEDALPASPRLFILKAFTKLYALAGLRVGYLLCGSASAAAGVAGTGQAWPVSSLAQAAGVAALRETSYAEAVRHLVRSERETMKAGLQDAGLSVIGGDANYIFFEIPAGSGFDRRRFFQDFRAAGILVRDCADYPGLDGAYCRIALRKPEENRRLLAAIREMRHTRKGAP
ncbi:MAG: pyridoxal phosphate-dependent class II aminotransferase [Spirochaetaceae bacterium]|jgi:threonine-phosphate decarboxylase|nr:pyridoxal phosphate-dependent class II aminotransferase [Spirochaetaceae bacterium]